MPREYQNRGRWGRAAAAAAAAILCGLAGAQSLPLGGLTGSNFMLPEFYDVPHETQMKSLLQGDQATPLEGGVIRITGIRLQTFREDGTGEFEMEADDCYFNTTNRNVNSAGPLELRTSDGRFLTTGKGFLWRQAESTLIISNHVHTVLRYNPTNQARP